MGFFSGISDALFGSKGSPGQHGIDIVYPDEYDDYLGLRSNLINYYQGILQGQEPAFFSSYLPRIEEQQEQALNRYYLGEGAHRGSSAMGLAEQIGASKGIGAPATVSAQNRVANELSAKKAAARAAMDKYRLNWMGNAQNMAQQGLQNLPRAKDYYASGYNIQPTQGGPGFLQGALEAWGGAGFPGMGSLGKMFGGGGGGGSFGNPITDPGFIGMGSTDVGGSYYGGDLGGYTSSNNIYDNNIGGTPSSPWGISGSVL